MRTIDDFSRNIVYKSPMEEYFGKIIRKWVEDEVFPVRRKFDEDWKEHKLIEPAFKKLMVDLGMQKALFPEEFGGLGIGHSSYGSTITYRMLEEISRGDSGMGVAFGVTFWPLTLITMEPHVNKRLCREFAPMFVDAAEPVFAASLMTEPQGGSDIENIDLVKGRTIKTVAKSSGNDLIIKGHKLWPTNTGGVAKLLGVVATTKAGSTNEDDFAYIFVPADAEGVTQGKPYEKAGMAADKNSDIWLENVKVPDYYRAWGPGKDALYFRELISWGSLGSCAFSTGVMLNSFEIIYDFVSKYKLNGKLMKEHDSVAGELADIVSLIEISRIAGYHLAEILDRPDLYGNRWEARVTSLARAYKYTITDNAVKVLNKIMDLMSVFGVDRNYDIEKHWRDLKIIQLWMGGKQLSQVEVARWWFESNSL